MVEGGSLTVCVPEFQGTFEIGAKSDILRRILANKHYEPSIAEIVKRLVNPTMDVIDVGANVGFYTVLAAKLLSGEQRVLSIEPTPGALRLLHNNLLRNSVTSRVLVFEGAATSTARSIVVNMVEGQEEYSSTTKLSHPAVEGAPITAIQVNGQPLDKLVAQFGLSPGFIKIDTEGTECDVLLGSKSTLERYRPVIVYEAFPDDMLIAAGGIPGKSADLLLECKYKITSIDAVNFLAIPQEISDNHAANCHI